MVRNVNACVVCGTAGCNLSRLQQHASQRAPCLAWEHLQCCSLGGLLVSRRMAWDAFLPPNPSLPASPPRGSLPRWLNAELFQTEFRPVPLQSHMKKVRGAPLYCCFCLRYPTRVAAAALSLASAGDVVLALG